MLAVRNADRGIVELLLAFGAAVEGRHGETNEYLQHIAAVDGADSLISLLWCEHPEWCKDRETDQNTICNVTKTPVEDNQRYRRHASCEVRSLISDLPCKCRDCQLGPPAGEYEKNKNFYNEDQANCLEARSDIGHDVQRRDGKSALDLAFEQRR